MTERLLKRFEQRLGSQEAAQAQYLKLWQALERNGYRVKFVKEERSKTLPQLPDSDGRRVIIPSAVETMIADGKPRDLHRILYQERSKRTRQSGELNPEQIYQMVHEEAENEQVRAEEMRRRKKEAMITLAVLAPVAVFYKAVQADASIPPILQGRLEDILAVPFYGSILRMSFPQADKKKVALAGLAIAFGEEFGQKFHVLPGTWDPGDLVAYTVGAVGYIGHLALHESKIKLESKLAIHRGNKNRAS